MATIGSRQPPEDEWSRLPGPPLMRFWRWRPICGRVCRSLRSHFALVLAAIALIDGCRPLLKSTWSSNLNFELRLSTIPSREPSSLYGNAAWILQSRQVKSEPAGPWWCHSFAISSLRSYLSVILLGHAAGLSPRISCETLTSLIARQPSAGMKAINSSEPPLYNRGTGCKWVLARQSSNGLGTA